MPSAAFSHFCKDFLKYSLMIFGCNVRCGHQAIALSGTTLVAMACCSHRTEVAVAMCISSTCTVVMPAVTDTLKVVISFRRLLQLQWQKSINGRKLP